MLTLGRSTAITLGVNYKWVVLRSLMIVSILASASTVLVGPVTFLGILIVSIARFIFPTYRHIVLRPGTARIDFRHAAYRTVAQLLRAPERNHQFRWRGLLYLPDHEN